ncbi:MAG TPA: sugar phosphate nucleotidyltransferase, partial [Woeseiaceae bacterium]|nr:sugar phosphate nucleotidyltransferase [Woeseiaceae bacterium]
LAGGCGSRLGALTRHRCKPALPFGGRYRSVDFTLSNCVNSGFTRIGVATQYRARSLIEHIQQSWWPLLSRARGECLELWAAEQHEEARWYAGTADAVYQNLSAIGQHRPRQVLVLAADHVYRMNYAALVACHRDSGADVTVACQPVPAEQACQFGIMSVAGDEIVAFREKPLGVAGGGDVLASMGVYVFDAERLRSLLDADASRSDSRHDFGRDIIPACVQAPGIRVLAYPFRDPCTGGAGYWRDIGTIDAYWSANMELLAREPALDPDDPDWPIWAAPDRVAPTRMAECAVGRPMRISQAIVAGGCRLEGATVYRSIVSGGVRVGAGSVIEDSILLPGARIGANCHVRKAIVERGIELPDGCSVGLGTMPAVRETETSPGGVTILSPWAIRQPREPARRRRTRTDKTSQTADAADCAGVCQQSGQAHGTLQ